MKFAPKSIIHKKAVTRSRTDHFSNILADHDNVSADCYLFTVLNSGLLFLFSLGPVTINFEMTLAFKLDVDSVTLNQHDKYLRQMSFCSKVIVGTHTHWTDCSTWITKVVGNYDRTLGSRWTE